MQRVSVSEYMRRGVFALELRVFSTDFLTAHCADRLRRVAATGIGGMPHPSRAAALALRLSQADEFIFVKLDLVRVEAEKVLARPRRRRSRRLWASDRRSRPAWPAASGTRSARIRGSVIGSKCTSVRAVGMQRIQEMDAQDFRGPAPRRKRASSRRTSVARRGVKDAEVITVQLVQDERGWLRLAG
jgi:hypothetical protein